MKALEFQGQVNANATLSLPSEVARQLAPERRVRVLLLIADDAEAQAWERLAAQDFLEGYSPSDAIYDQLPAR